MNIATPVTHSCCGHQFEPDHLHPIVSQLFMPSGVDGVYGRTGAYESVIEALAALISRHRPETAEVFRFAPVMPRASLEKQGYLKSFPNLIGAVSTLTGSDREITRSANKYEEGGDWTEDLKPSDLVLAPAACYPIYPIAAERGVVPDDGYIFDVAADCFRHEPSRHVDRFQSFRMREYVRIGTPRQIQEFRDPWIERAKGIADAIGLPYTVDVANDPFFGRVGTMMATQQRADALKFELLVPVRSKDSPTACMSFNYHKEHFGEVWGLHNKSGEVLHTGCVAFGMDRLAVALFVTHGARIGAWPARVREALKL
ncbi:MAG TPA: amino acid--[acyl-carrier-protein] ligase [Rhizomicrobium sp.]|nr:amino acid--[acyl-carrier-protein] ligase [Rhizomicrobium sp.]